MSLSPDLDSAILQTLSYSNHFGSPLTLKEIHTRLVSPAPCSREQVATALQRMLKAKSIFKKGDYFHLPGQGPLVAQRLSHSQYSASQLESATRLAAKLAHTPGVLAIYLTGSLAMANSTPESDIDFMIITSSGHLWTTRLLLTLYTSLMGLRRTPHSKKITGKLCLNLYLSPPSYLLPTDRRTLYTAYELVQARPLYDPQNTHSKLLSSNAWINKYLPNFSIPNPILGRKRENGKTGILEYFLYRLQLLYMKNKMTREYVTPDSAFFHPHNPAPKV